MKKKIGVLLFLALAVSALLPGLSFGAYTYPTLIDTGSGNGYSGSVGSLLDDNTSTYVTYYNVSSQANAWIQMTSPGIVKGIRFYLYSPTNDPYIQVTVGSSFPGGMVAVTQGYAGAGQGWKEFTFPDNTANQPYVGLYIWGSGNLQISEIMLESTPPPDPPDAPTLNSPSDNATSISIRPTLRWNMTEGAETFNLQVAPDDTFTDGTIEISGLTSFNYTITEDLNFNHQYYWRVIAVNVDGETTSTVRSFTTRAEGVTLPPDTQTTWYNDWDGQTYTDYEAYIQASTLNLPTGNIQMTKDKFVGLMGMLGVALSSIFVGGVLKSIL